MLAKITNAVSVVFLFLLVFTLLAFKVMQQELGIVIIQSDAIIANVFFIFACLAGIITWHADKHISLAAFADKFPPAAKKITGHIKNAAITLTLTSLFFAALSRTFSTFSLTETIFGIPTLLIFGILPLTYLTLMILVCRQKTHFASALVGIFLGLLIATGPIANLIYTLGGNVPQIFDSIFAGWQDFTARFAAPLVIFFAALAFLGVPLFVVLSAVAYICFSQGGGYVDVLPLESYQILTDKSVAAIPLFTITGYVLSRGSAGRRFVEVFRTFFGAFRGGTVVGAVIVATFFTTFTGVSGVTILALGTLITLILTGSGYDKDKAQSLATASGAIGLLFPPSVAIIMYGTTNYFSVDIVDLFKASLLPGCLLALGMILIGFVFDKNTQRTPFKLADALHALRGSVFEFLLPLLFCFAYFSGILTLSESAAFAVIYTFCLAAFIRKDFAPKQALAVIIESIPISGGVLFILAAARGLSYFIMDANIPVALADFVGAHISSKYVFLILLNAALLFVGCLMDIYSAILIVSPLVVAIAELYGIAPVHIGVIFLMNMQIGFLTPPVGMDLFIASYTFNQPVFKVVRGILPFLLVQLIILLIVTYIPWFSTALLSL
ncbi:MAG: TRAP transporter large permease subunit [Treponemataceae bacterium]|nr:MAG: TRAP transporter large permease subunit [Treponemataceae bacterium]